MRTTLRALGVAAMATSMIALASAAKAADMLGSGVTVYMQMGGQPGEPPVLPRTNGAKAAAASGGSSGPGLSASEVSVVISHSGSAQGGAKQIHSVLQTRRFVSFSIVSRA